ncbi:hypothetical protein BT93_J0439 [Corymbia citriodora subsp. variegata]|nr:hypothetical protein BT93_J0439 [Corymbia citriodora subsp. variegata]
MKEITGESGNITHNKTGVRTYRQALAGISHISFGEEESVSPRRPTTLPEAAKQRELSGTLGSELDGMLKKQISHAKTKELSGHDAFAPPPEILPRTAASRSPAMHQDRGEPAPRNLRTSVKVSNSTEEPVLKTAKKIYDKEFTEPPGNDIFKGDVPSSSAEKSLSVGKLHEISGNDIFADNKVESQDYLGDMRKPPGGESSITLV